jgi:hypothetical protein
MGFPGTEDGGQRSAVRQMPITVHGGLRLGDSLKLERAPFDLRSVHVHRSGITLSRWGVAVTHREADFGCKVDFIGTVRWPGACAAFETPISRTEEFFTNFCGGWGSRSATAEWTRVVFTRPNSVEKGGRALACGGERSETPPFRTGVSGRKAGDQTLELEHIPRRDRLAAALLPPTLTPPNKAVSRFGCQAPPRLPCGLPAAGFLAPLESHRTPRRAPQVRCITDGTTRSESFV